MAARLFSGKRASPLSQMASGGRNEHVLISYLGGTRMKRFMDGTVGGILADNPIWKAFLALMGIRCVLVAQVIANFGKRQRGEQGCEKDFHPFRSRHRLGKACAAQSA